MGIDIYARWEGQTEAEKEAQYTGFSTTAGAVGYLREAYHGGPYVTQWLMPEAFSPDLGGRTLAEATGAVQALVRGIGEAATAAGAVVEGLTAETLPESPPDGYLVDECEVVGDEDKGYMVRIPAAILERRLPLCLEIAEIRLRKVYQEDLSPEERQSYVDFVGLIRRLEDEGKRPAIYASW